MVVAVAFSDAAADGEDLETFLSAFFFCFIKFV